jgi:hypothetical protein
MYPALSVLTFSASQFCSNTVLCHIMTTRHNANSGSVIKVGLSSCSAPLGRQAGLLTQQLSPSLLLLLLPQP